MAGHPLRDAPQKETDYRARATRADYPQIGLPFLRGQKDLLRFISFPAPELDVSSARAKRGTPFEQKRFAFTGI